MNSHERPLALYFYTKDKHKGDRVLRETYSGGACLNAMEEHVVHPSMPFGGIGNSGMGRYNGYEGFKTFSNQRSVYQKRWSLLCWRVLSSIWKETGPGYQIRIKGIAIRKRLALLVKRLA